MADASTTSKLRVSRPTFNVGGQDNETLANGLLDLLIAESTQGLYHCEAKFGNWGPAADSGSPSFLYFDRQTFDFGKALKVKLGDDVVFDGRISALEARFPDGGGPPEFVALAEDRFQDLRMTRRTRTFTQVDDATIFQQIASDHGLTPDVSLTGPTHAVLAQVNQSDLAFLRERARSVDAELWLDGTTLHAKSRTDRGASTVTLGFGNELREVSVTADLAGQRSSVTMTGWDVANKSAIKEDAGDSVLGSELGGDKSGASILGQSLGERKESLVHTIPLGTDEARSRAESFFKAGARRFVLARGVAQTDAKLRVGAKVDLRGIGPLFSGKYYVSEVRHVFDGGKGLRTEFVAERPGLSS